MSKFNWKNVLGKKWTFPAIYMVTAALILALMWWYQDPNEYSLTKEEIGLEEIVPEDVQSPTADAENTLSEDLGDAIAVNKAVEKMMWPVEDPENVQVTMEFFDENGQEDIMENAIVSFQNELWPHSGIDIVSSDGNEFNVVAALSGEVTRAFKDPVVGYIVELKHENGLATVYSSLKDLKVEEGDQVTQGTILGLASRNSFEKDQGVHLHFEVRKDDLAVNPDAFFEQEVDKVLEELEDNNESTNE